MKISKEGHKRMSVTLKNEEVQKNAADKAEGQILPLEKGQKLKTYIQKRVDSSKRLYKVLGPSAVSKLNVAKSEAVLKCFNDFMKNIIDNNVRVKPADKRDRTAVDYIQNRGFSIEVRDGTKEDKSNENRGKKKEQKEIKKPLSDVYIDVDEAFVHELTRLNLRGTLKKKAKIEKDGTQVDIYIPDIIEKLVFATTHGSQFDSLISQIGEAELTACIHIIFMDYTKEEQIKKIAKSIENQDVKVQVLGKGKDARLQLASADNEKKKYIFLFLEKFACAASEEERDNLLREFRELIVLFYCGTVSYEEIKERKTRIPVWDFSFLSKMVSDVPLSFSQECSEKLAERELLKAETDLERRKENKLKIRDINTEVKRNLERIVAQRYQEGIKILGDVSGEEYKEKRFWLEYIENDAEKVLCSKKTLSENKLDVLWLCENTWRSFLSFICSKAVDMGKAVYHFAMPDLEKIESGKPVRAGEIKPQFRKGITSFDYEKIKAEENLERSFMTAISFALNNFSSAVCPPETYEKEGKEDILFMGDDALQKEMYPNASWRILQYFGGASQWKDSRFEEVSDSQKAVLINESFVPEIRRAMQLIRNSAFHYAASAAQSTLDSTSYLVEIFEREKKLIGSKYRKKYVSNNVPVFYKVEDIDHLMKSLYGSQKVLESQIPSFRNVISRKSLPELINQYSIINGTPYRKMKNDVATSEKFHAALYFVLKEIYYNGFLQEDNLMERFMDSFHDELKEVRDNTSKASAKKVKAMENFEERIKELRKGNKSLSFGEVCQAIMTDYNLQNNQKKVRLNGKDNLPDEKYKHFKMLLLVCLRRTFVDYLQKDVEGERFGCKFLKEPRLKEKIYDNLTEEQFCNGWQTDRYNNLMKGDSSYDSWLISWFIMAHFMTPKHLNHLRGEIKSYLSYVQNIERRRWNATGIQIEDEKEKRKKYEQVLEVLELAAEYCGQVSKERTDYYESEEEYARHISRYIAFDDSKSERPLEEQLYGFCNQKVAGGTANRIGIFYDGENPVLNRNVVIAKLYGTEGLLSECLQDDRVTKADIEKYYKLADSDSLKAVFKYGGCKNQKQEEERREYQQHKNRIELVDILKYSDLLNDFMSQLISWCYLRERDRMYFQMGLHYIRLYYGKNIVEKDSRFRILQSKEVRAGGERGIHLTDGAILYQLAAIYTYEYPVYALDEEGNATVSKKAKSGSTMANSITAFWKEYCEGDASAYEMGLRLFENPIEEGELIFFGNYMDLFKYYSQRDRSILDLYSQVFATYFRNDKKLKKSVTFIFKNILARHFVIAKTVLDVHDEPKKDKRKDKKNPKIRTYKQAEIRIAEKDGLESDVTIHKYTKEDLDEAYKKKAEGDRNIRVPKEGGKYSILLYDESFIERLYRILNYHK